MNKAEAGHFAKAGVEAGRGLHEFALDAAKLGELKVGDAITVEVFQVGQLVDVTGTSQGKGFAGSIKRHNFSSNRASHGNSVSHRAWAPSVWPRIRVACFRASAWPVSW